MHSGNASRRTAALSQKMSRVAISSSSGAGSQPSSSSSQKYAKVPQMSAHDPIPPPSKAAIDSAVRTYDYICKLSPKLVKQFRSLFHAWQTTWQSTGGASSNAQSRCNVAEFSELLKMGPVILPLVVYMLLDRHNFTAVFLYNALEQDTRFRIDPADVLNFLVLQRQNNLIIDLNRDRRWPMFQR